jgi:nicotinate-nucleotide adenylyltransferase
MTREEYKALVRPFLTEKRFHHSECVAEEAESLAKQYGADPEKAWIAGMLHDIMKELPPEEQLKKMDAFGIILSDLEKSAPKLYHAILGAAYLEQTLHITDRDIIDPVLYHTTARADMTLPEKILFMADYISADRTFEGVEELRKTAYEDLDEAVLLGCGYTIQDLSERYLTIHPDTVGAYNWYVLHRKSNQP